MTEKKPTLCIVAGPNGSGKTSTTIQLLHYEWGDNSLYINPDNIAQEKIWRLEFCGCRFKSRRIRYETEI